MPIDYARAKREHPRCKAALTRARNSGDPVKVLEAVEKAYDAFDAWGAWPDDWAHWRVALQDAWFGYARADEGDLELLDRFDAALAR